MGRIFLLRCACARGIIHRPPARLIRQTSDNAKANKTEGRIVSAVKDLPGEATLALVREPVLDFVLGWVNFEDFYSTLLGLGT